MSETDSLTNSGELLSKANSKVFRANNLVEISLAPAENMQKLLCLLYHNCFPNQDFCIQFSTK